MHLKEIVTPVLAKFVGAPKSTSRLALEEAARLKLVNRGRDGFDELKSLVEAEWSESSEGLCDAADLMGTV